MNSTQRSIFNERAAERLRNPDDLDRYVRITSPSVWAVVGALACLLAGLLAWGIFGSVSTSVVSTGVRVGQKVMCFLDAGEVARVDVGDDSLVDGKRLHVSSVASMPMSRDETENKLNSDYLKSALVKSDWTYMVEFEGDETDNIEQGVPITVDITTERVAPITLLIGR